MRRPREYELTHSTPPLPAGDAVPPASDAAPPASAIPAAAAPEIPGRIRRRSTFSGDVLRLVSGTTLAQLITALSAPLLARLYPPEAFGVLALFGSISALLGVIVCMRYELSIMLPESDSEAANLLGASLFSALAVSLLTVPLVVFGRAPVVRLLKAPELGPLLWLLPPTVFVSGVFLALNYWNSRTGNFGRLSVVRVAASATATVVQVGGGLTHPTGGSLLAASLAGSSVSTTILGRQILRENGALFRESITLHGVLSGIRRHRKFPLMGTVSALLNSASWQLPSFVLQIYFSTAVVGFYSLGNQLLRVPMSLIGGSISQVFYQRAAEAHRAGRLTELVDATFRRLVSLSLFPMVLLGLVGRDAFSIALGSRWAEAGVYAQILSVWTFFWFISSPLSTLFSILERQEFGLKLNVVILSTRFLSLAAGGWLGSARLALIFFSASGVVVYGYYSFAILHASGLKTSRIAGDLLRSLLELIPAIVVLGCAKLLKAPPGVTLAAAGIFFIAYSIRAIRRDPAILGKLQTMPVLRRLGFLRAG